MATERSAADVFGLLSDETRLDVLRAVATAQHENREAGLAGLSFSELYERVDVENTSKLSYHLGELTGTFLRKTESGYAFTHAGEQLVRFILARNYEAPPDFGHIDVSGRCLFCGERGLRASLEEQYFMIRCGDCDRPAFSYRVRPAQVRSNEPEALIDAVIWEQAGDFLKIREGVCPDCAGRVETDVLDAESAPAAAPVSLSFGTVNECRQCKRLFSIPLPYVAAYHPESVAFHWEHGVDILGTGAWEFHNYIHDGRWSSHRVASDPDEFRVEFQRETTALKLFLDETATVTRVERVQRRDHGNRRR